MTLQNRVHPDGSLHASAAHGTLMGNRGGRFHCSTTKALLPRRHWVSRAWIACRLDFKGRKRQVWGDSYTELFFLDEVTALSAGHRPCFECRRADARRFRQALMAGLGTQEGWTEPPKAPAMDNVLHAARLDASATSARLGDLPGGTMVCADNRVFALTSRGLRPWSFEGYGRVIESFDDDVVELLTPAPIVAALRGGYAPAWHASAEENSGDGPTR